MALKRMDNVGIVVEDLTAAIDFFGELGLALRDVAQQLEDVDHRIVWTAATVSIPALVKAARKRLEAA